MNYGFREAYFEYFELCNFSRDNTNIDVSVFMVDLRMINMSSGTLFTKHAEINCGKFTDLLCKVYATFTDLLCKVYATFTEILRRIHKASVNFAESTEGFRKFYGTTHSSVGARSVIKKIYHS